MKVYLLLKICDEHKLKYTFKDNRDLLQIPYSKLLNKLIPIEHVEELLKYKQVRKC